MLDEIFLQTCYIWSWVTNGSTWKKKLSMGFLHAKIIWQNLECFARQFYQAYSSYFWRVSSGVYVRGFFMWHWLDPARRYSTPIHKVSYSLLWSRDEEKCLALLVRNPRFSCKKIYFFLHHSDGGGEASHKLFQNKEVQLDEMFHWKASKKFLITKTDSFFHFSNRENVV